MDRLSLAARLTAALVALVAWSGLLVQWQASTALMGDGAAALWAMLRFFTVLTNLLDQLWIMGRPQTNVMGKQGGTNDITQTMHSIGAPHDRDTHTTVTFIN